MQARGDVAAALGTLCHFYSRHIEKEDKSFFPAARAYFSDVEDQAMIHEKYAMVVERLERR